MNRDIVVIGASAGGVEGLTELCRHLPADFPAAVLVVLHVSPHANSVLPAMLNRAGALQARHASDDEPIESGHIYLAPPDHHLLVQDERIRVMRGPRENGHRPAVDPLFRSAARFGGPRVIGVVLSGALDDGTAGLIAVKARGGLAIVQDPGDAFHPSMPLHAIENVAVDCIVPLHQLAATLIELVNQPLDEPLDEPIDEPIDALNQPRTDVTTSSKTAFETPTQTSFSTISATPALNPSEENSVSQTLKIETEMAALEPGALHSDERPGTPSGFSCPECHGVLFELKEGQYVRYRCRVGHAYSPDSLLADQSQSLEAALWIALRALEESGALARRAGERAASRSQIAATQNFVARAAKCEANAELIRQVLLSNEDLVAGSQPPSIELGDEA